MDYEIKPYLKSIKIEEIDNRRRRKIEKILGRKLLDYEWIKYKQLMDVNRKK